MLLAEEGLLTGEDRAGEGPGTALLPGASDEEAVGRVR